MGGGTYNISSRTLRSEKASYTTASTETLFTQVKQKRIHELVDPKQILRVKGKLIRECRDSAEHPRSFPIILPLDVTGSMREIPRKFLADGLPRLISKIMQNGLADPTLLLACIGDSAAGDRAPFQVGEFEASDLELDNWLQRMWPEGGGGGNAGESYLWSWYFAARCTSTDHFEKRGQKGILITIGDEPSLPSISSREFQEVLGEGNHQPCTDVDLLAEAQKMYEVYHLHMMEGSAGPRSLGYWQQLLGDRCITVNNYNDLPETIADLVIKVASSQNIIDTTSAAAVDSPITAETIKHNTILL